MYLLINILSISIPFIFSFHKRIKFYENWKGFFLGLFIINLLFIPFDIYFTNIGIWGFNDSYLFSYSLFNLPIEEWLFFICIPYASIFIFFIIYYKTSFATNNKLTTVISYLLILLLFLGILFHYDKSYTLFVCIVTSLVVILSTIFFREELSVFYIAFLLIIIPFFIVNGILTGMWIENEIVWYNNEENLGIRIFTIPIEDVFYAFALLLPVSIFTVKYDRKKNKHILVSERPKA